MFYFIAHNAENGIGFSFALNSTKQEEVMEVAIAMAKSHPGCYRILRNVFTNQNPFVKNSSVEWYDEGLSFIV